MSATLTLGHVGKVKVHVFFRGIGQFIVAVIVMLSPLVPNATALRVNRTLSVIHSHRTNVGRTVLYIVQSVAENRQTGKELVSLQLLVCPLIEHFTRLLFRQLGNDHTVDLFLRQSVLAEVGFPLLSNLLDRWVVFPLSTRHTQTSIVDDDSVFATHACSF